MAVGLGQPAVWLERSGRERFEGSCGPVAACEPGGGWPFGERRGLWGRDSVHGSGCAVAGCVLGEVEGWGSGGTWAVARSGTA